MKITHFQIVKKQDMFVLEAIIPPYYGYREVCRAEGFCRNRNSVILTFGGDKGFSLFALADDGIWFGPAEVFDYQDCTQAFVYQKQPDGNWFERSFDQNDEKCLGERSDNFFVSRKAKSDLFGVYMYDAGGKRRHFECRDWECMKQYNVFQLRNGLYEIYSAHTKLPEKMENTDLLLEDASARKIRFLWQKEKKSYKKIVEFR